MIPEMNYIEKGYYGKREVPIRRSGLFEMPEILMSTYRNRNGQDHNHFHGILCVDMDDYRFILLLDPLVEQNSNTQKLVKNRLKIREDKIDIKKGLVYLPREFREDLCLSNRVTIAAEVTGSHLELWHPTEFETHRREHPSDWEFVLNPSNTNFSEAIIEEVRV